MKGKVVPALWSKHGLRRGNGAEPQVVGLAPQSSNERKADTMKTYLLRGPKPVEPQQPAPPTQPFETSYE